MSDTVQRAVSITTVSVTIDFLTAEKPSSRCMCDVRNLGEDRKSVNAWCLQDEAPPLERHSINFTPVSLLHKGLQ